MLLFWKPLPKIKLFPIKQKISPYIKFIIDWWTQNVKEWKQSKRQLF